MLQRGERGHTLPHSPLLQESTVEICGILRLYWLFEKYNSASPCGNWSHAVSHFAVCMESRPTSRVLTHHPML